MEHDKRNSSVKQIGFVKGTQTGEYFGAALAAVDVNGDGIDELIVGSPLFTHQSRSTTLTANDGALSGSSFEEGRVTIFQLDDNERFQVSISAPDQTFDVQLHLLHCSWRFLYLALAILEQGLEQQLPAWAIWMGTVWVTLLLAHLLKMAERGQLGFILENETSCQCKVRIV